MYHLALVMNCDIFGPVHSSAETCLFDGEKMVELVLCGTTQVQWLHQTQGWCCMRQKNDNHSWPDDVHPKIIQDINVFSM